MSIKIMILEDDAIQALDLKEMLNESGYDQVYVAHRPEQAIELFNAEDPDLVLLDVKIEGHTMSGIDVGEYIAQRRMLPLIYLTAYPSDFYEQAKLTRPAGYFGKPYRRGDLLNAIDLAVYNYSERLSSDGSATNSDNADSFKQMNLYYASDRQHIWLKTGATAPFQRILVQDISHINADNNYLQIYTKTKLQPYIVTARISRFVAQIQHPLVQSHRSWIVNVNYIEKFTSKSLTINRNGDSINIPISETYLEAVMKALQDQNK
jgi:DNA-binding LytR/AlgR family response regulator